MVRLAVVIAICFSVVSIGVDAYAQSLFYWDLEKSGSPESMAEQFRTALGKDSAKHILTKSDLESQLTARQIEIPSCFLGVEPCDSPFAILFDTLDLMGVVRITKTEGGFSYALIDRRKETVISGGVANSDPQQAAFKIIGDLFNATATLVIETNPPDASVSIDSAEAKPSPVQVRLPVGAHQYSVEKLGYKTVEGVVNLNSGDVENLTLVLEPIPAVVRFTEATEGAEIFINGKLVGPASEPIELPPGNHTMEIRREGFESIHEALTVESGQVLTRNAALESANPLLRDVSIEAIAHRKYHLRVAFEHGIQSATFQDARTSDGERFVGLLDDNDVLPDGDPFGRNAHSNGVRVAALYQLRHVGLTVMSASLVTGTPDVTGVVDLGANTVQAKIDRSTRLQLRPAQINYRRFYKNFVPSVELGVGIDFHWFKANRLDTDERLSFHNVESFWTLGLVAQYFVTNGIFAWAKYGFQDYFTQGPGSDHVFNIGAGFALGNLLGLDPEPPEQL